MAKPYPTGKKKPTFFMKITIKTCKRARDQEIEHKLKIQHKFYKKMFWSPKIVPDPMNSSPNPPLNSQNPETPASHQNHNQKETKPLKIAWIPNKAQETRHKSPQTRRSPQIRKIQGPVFLWNQPAPTWTPKNPSTTIQITVKNIRTFKKIAQIRDKTKETGDRWAQT